VRIPQALAEEWRGEPAWLAELPRLAAECAARWQLRLEEPIDTPHSFVAPAGEAVLKLNAPSHFEADHEADALEHWGGGGAVRLLARDDGRRALLIERCVPGTELWNHGADEPAVLAELLPRLRLEPREPHPFRLLADEATVPGRHRLQGALLAGTGFEALKLVATALVAGALGNPAFATLGVSLVLGVWMNYFSRLVIFGASWAAVAGEVRRALGKEEPTAEPLDPPPLADAVPVPAGAGPYGVQPGGRGAFARGLVSGAGLAVVVWALTGRRR